MKSRQLLRIVWARRAIVLAAASGLALLALTVSLLLPQTYMAIAEVIADPQSADPITGASQASPGIQNFVATQVEIVESERVARAVIQSLGLEKSVPWLRRWIAETGRTVPFRPWLIQRLRQDLDVRSSRDGNVIRIGFRTRTPVDAARLANAFASAYLETVLALRIEPARQNAVFFDDRMAAARAQLEMAQARLTKFQRANGISSSDERLDIEQTRLSELSTQLSTLQGEVLAAKSRGAAVSGGGVAGLTEVLDSRLVQKLRGDLADAEARLQRLRLTLGDAHPDVQKSQAEVATMRKKVDSELDRYADGLRVTASINDRRLSGLTQVVEAQRTKVLRLRSLRDELAVYQEEVQTARRNLEAVSQRLVTTTMESHSRQTNAAMLSPASVPIRPVSPSLLNNVLGAAFAGVLLGLAYVFFLEHRLRPVRAPEDLRETLMAPVLGILPLKQRKKRTSWLVLALRAWLGEPTSSKEPLR